MESRKGTKGGYKANLRPAGTAGRNGVSASSSFLESYIDAVSSDNSDSLMGSVHRGSTGMQ